MLIVRKEKEREREMGITLTDKHPFYQYGCVVVLFPLLFQRANSVSTMTNGIGRQVSMALLRVSDV